MSLLNSTYSTAVREIARHPLSSSLTVYLPNLKLPEFTGREPLDRFLDQLTQVLNLLKSFGFLTSNNSAARMLVPATCCLLLNKHHSRFLSILRSTIMPSFFNAVWIICNSTVACQKSNKSANFSPRITPWFQTVQHQSLTSLTLSRKPNTPWRNSSPIFIVLSLAVRLK